MHLLASFWVNFKLSDQLWHKIAFFYSIWLLFCGNCFSSVLAIPCGWLLNTGLTVCFFFINHCYSTLILFSLLFRKEMKSNKLSSNWSSSFLEFDSSPENLSAENLATIVAIMLLLKRLLWQAPLSVIKLKKCMILLNSSTNRPLLVRRMTREEKNLQLLVFVPKEILESSDLTAQVYFSVVNVLQYNF